MLNWVWYWSVTSDELTNIMTDIDGHVHRKFMPIGKIRPEIWDIQLKNARSIMPPPILDLIKKTTKPFLALVNEHLSTQATFFDGKMVLVGDALSLFRPHVALSANQAALHCLNLKKVMEGKMSMRRWEGEALRYAKATGLSSVAAGHFGLSKYGQLFFDVVRYLVCIIGQKLSSFWHSD